MIEKWTGHYIYGESFPTDIAGTPVAFDIEWVFEDGIIKGVCTDDESKNIFNSPATINGFIDTNIISVIKIYPCYWYIDQAGNAKLFEDIPSLEIHYSGSLASRYKQKRPSWLESCSLTYCG